MTKASLDKEQKAALDKVIAAFDIARSALTDHAQDLLDEWESEISNTRESWQQSDAGIEAQSRVDTLQSWIEQLDGLDLDPNELTSS